MTDAALVRGALPRSASAAALAAAATLWLIVMLAGQWVFLYYVTAFYAGPTLSGDFAAWNRHPFLTKGHIPGDTIGNLAFAAHVMLAILIAFGGTLQLVPQIRARATWLHRWNGRVFMATSIAAALVGLYMVWLRGAVVGGMLGAMSITLNGVLVLVFATLAWRAAAIRNITLHRRWALRALLVVNGVFFLRLLFSGWLLLTQSEPSALMFRIFEFASYLLPLAVLELYLRAKDSHSPGLRHAAAATLFASSAYMAVGTVGFALIFVRMVLGAT